MKRQSKERYGTPLPDVPKQERDDDDRPYWRTPQSVFYKGRTPKTRLRCFAQLSEEQAQRRHRAAEGRADR